MKKGYQFVAAKTYEQIEARCAKLEAILDHQSATGDYRTTMDLALYAVLNNPPADCPKKDESQID